jgi:uncharacterized protein
MSKTLDSSRVKFVFESAKAFYNNGDPGHDLLHIQRVMKSCYKIAPTVGANLEVLLSAAILHDIVNLPKNHPERLTASEMAAAKAQQILTDAGFDKDEIAKISAVIKEHSYSLGLKPSTIEAAVLQDADRLDALGAIGVFRTVSCGVKMGSAYYDEQEPFAVRRDLDDKSFTIDHFFVKLLKLPALMNTELARIEAEARVRFMRSMLGQLYSEVTG